MCYIHRNSLKLNWVSLVLAWMIFPEVVEYIIHCQERILNSVNWESGILHFSLLQKTQIKSRAAIFCYKANIWISKPMIALLCQTVAMIMASWELIYLQVSTICVYIFNFVWNFISYRWNSKEKLISPGSGEEQLALPSSLQKRQCIFGKHRKTAGNWEGGGGCVPVYLPDKERKHAKNISAAVQRITAFQVVPVPPCACPLFWIHCCFCQPQSSAGITGSRLRWDAMDGSREKKHPRRTGAGGFTGFVLVKSDTHVGRLGIRSKHRCKSREVKECKELTEPMLWVALLSGFAQQRQFIDSEHLKTLSNACLPSAVCL